VHWRSISRNERAFLCLEVEWVSIAFSKVGDYGGIGGSLPILILCPVSVTMIRKVLLACALALLALTPNSASAYWPYYGYGGYGMGWSFNQPTDYIPAPPYFAVHPPVYYAPQITARHYGASPFAWPPGMAPITYGAMPVVQSVVIKNPHVTTSTENASEKVAAVSHEVEAVETEIQPLRIDNPFVVSTTR